MINGAKRYPGSEPCPRCGAEVTVVEYTPPATPKNPTPSTSVGTYCTNSTCETARREEEYMASWREERRKDLIESMLKRSDLPKRYKKYTLDSFDPNRSAAARRGLQVAQDYVANWTENLEDGKGLYFVGPVGTGKTMLAVGIMWELMRKYKVATLFTTAPDLLDNMRKDIGADNDDDYIESVKRAELLVMDDLGAERLTEWSEERLFVIVNHRYREGLPTIFTTNVSLDETAARLGVRCDSRIDACTDNVVMLGKDQRKVL